MYSYPHYLQTPYSQYPYMQMDYQAIYNQFYLPYQNQLPQFRQHTFHQAQQPAQQLNYITISDDEESTPKQEIPKPIPPQLVQSVQTLKQITKMLDLDQLEASGKLFDCESSPLLLYQNKLYKSQKASVQAIEKERIKLSNALQKDLYHASNKFKQVKTGSSKYSNNPVSKSDQSEFMREMKINVILKLYEKLKLNFPQANDEDVVIILNNCNKDYSKAESFIQESGCSISYYLNSQKDQQIDETTTDGK